MNKPVIKNIQLNKGLWILATVIIRTNEVTSEENNTSDPEHGCLAEKIMNAGANALSNPGFAQSFTETERIRMRRYIFSYCENLSIHWQSLPDSLPWQIVHMKEVEMRALYKMAMAVYTSFSSL